MTLTLSSNWQFTQWLTSLLSFTSGVSLDWVSVPLEGSLKNRGTIALYGQVCDIEVWSTQIRDIPLKPLWVTAFPLHNALSPD
jgi:hypothetical protein